MNGWTLTPTQGYTAVCDGCGYDLLSDSDFVSWTQPEGVDAALEDVRWCPKCNHPFGETEEP